MYIRLILSLSISLLYSCNQGEVIDYKEKEIINQIDSIKVEQIKIETH